LDHITLDLPDRHRLGRTCQGPQSARLSLDRAPPSFESTMELVQHLSQSALPVYTPHTQIPIYRIDRGGEVTYHGPGQLVIYPQLDLKKTPTLRPDLHHYLRQLEQVVMDTLLEEYDLVTTRDPAHTGVWYGDAKIAAVGVSATRWITTHGLALNVHPSLHHFDTSNIVPCGIVGKRATSIHQIVSPTTPITTQLVAQQILHRMECTFGLCVDFNGSIDIH
jgi:lipoyl(octanoyl) transferase